MSGKLRSIAANLLLVVTSLLFFLLIAEVLLSFIGFRPTERQHEFTDKFYQRDPVFGKRVRPNIHFKSKDPFLSWMPAIETNSLGYRMGEISFDKRPDEVRLLFLGDSHTFGWGVKIEEAFPQLVEDALNAKCNRHYRSVNLGVPSYDAYTEQVLLETFGVRFKPDVVFLQFASNDVLDVKPLEERRYDQPMHIPFKKYLQKSALYTFMKAIRDRTVRELMKKQKKQEIDQIMREIETERPYLPTSGSAQIEKDWSRYKQQLAKIHAFCKQSHMDFYFVLLPTVKQIITKSESRGDHVSPQDLLGQYADEIGFKVIDVLPALLAKEETVTLLQDGIIDTHLNANGHKVVAQEILAELKGNLTCPEREK